ncbi:hypothetical protein [Catellatospora vulcania]|uniref:hypothetical protein n=1 Tax=Catellatospora vulcania TaxID=1460450 RepID=UPI0012D38E02|nr:hypothetical protein [Catellatospora vulcania]
MTDTASSAGPPPEAARRPDPPDPGNSARDETEDAGQLRFEAQTITNIFGGVHAGAANFGGAHQTGWARTTGPVDSAQMDAILRDFVRPGPYEQALKVLHRAGLVVLVGEEGIGKRAGALALLRDAASGQDSVLALSPSYDFAQLAAYPHLKPGRGYLVQDMRGDGRSSPEQRFEIERLTRVLQAKQLRLVITAQPRSLSRTDLGDLVVDWDPPDLVDLFQRLLRRSGLKLSPADERRARAHLDTLCQPRQVAEFVDRLPQGVEAAMRSQSEQARQEASAWLEDSTRTDAEVLVAAAACFLSDLPERLFEQGVARLQQIVREHVGFDGPAARGEPVTSEQRLPQSRRLWAGRTGLVVTAGAGTSTDERRVAFRVPELRAHTIAEIWARYGHELLEPLRRWIRELAQDPSVEIRAQVAYGLSLLAKVNWSEVRESFLTQLSDGVAAERVTAAFTLSMMCADEDLASIALETALGWSENSGQRRAMTSAIACGGPMGVSHLGKAFEQLWYMTTRGAQIARVARTSLSLLTSGAEEAGRAMAVLRTTVDALHWVIRNGGALKRREALWTVLEILAAESFAAEELVIVRLMRDRDDAYPAVGTLLAAVLESGPHRHGAVNVLRRIITTLSGYDQGHLIAGRLGDAVFAHWPSHDLLRQQIRRELALSAKEAETARLVVHHFLTGLRAV